MAERCKPFTQNGLYRHWALTATEGALEGFEPLKNEVHPIFAFSNFNDTPETQGNVPLTEDYYDTLMPALRLATRFITEPHLLAWWCTLVLGKVRREPCHPGHPARPVLTHVEPTPDALRSVRETFKEMSNGLVRFSFRDVGPFGLTASDRVRNVVRIHLKPLFLKLNKRMGENTQHRFLWFFALVVVHELAHAVGAIKRRGVVAPMVNSLLLMGRTSMEPFHSLEETHAELGDSWEFSLWGGRICVIEAEPSQKAVGQFGFCWRRSGSKECRHMASRRGVEQYSAVAMDTFVNCFNENVWARVESGGLDALPVLLTSRTAHVAMTDERKDYSKLRREWLFRCDFEMDSDGRAPPARVKHIDIPPQPSHKRGVTLSRTSPEPQGLSSDATGTSAPRKRQRK